MFSTSKAASTFMPPAASAIAERVNNLYEFLLIISFISCVLVIGGLAYFVVKYRRRSENDKTAYILHNTALEFLWSFIPFVLFMIVFVWGWMIFQDLRAIPKGGLEIAVEAQKWSWNFVYKNGRTSAGELYVPLGQPVKFIMSSKDVLHSMYLPAFRNKQDVVPGRYTAMWFQPDKLGTFQIFCTEYCGDQHSGMLAKMHVVPVEKFEAWLATDKYKGMPLADIGKGVYTTSCKVCHSVDGTKGAGPSWKGIWMAKHQTDMGEVVVDENYIRESIMNPSAKTVNGFAKGVMPTFAGQLSDQEVLGLIEFIKTLQ